MNENENQTEVQSPVNESPAPEQENTPREKSAGGVISTIIVVVIILIGAVYLFNSREPVAKTPEITAEEITAAPDAQKENLLEQSTSDNVTAIEADLDTTNFDGLDSELQAIEAELTT